MKLIYSLLLIFCGFAMTNAQKTYAVEGTVQDFHDKTMLENSVVKIGEFSTKTDKKGKFSFNKIPAGTYQLIAKHPACDDYTENVKIDKDLHLAITLEHHIGEIETVNLHGSHKTKGSVIMKTLDKTEIERNSTENLGNLLSKISGVTALKTGNNISKPVIHGLYGSRVSVLNNGVKMAEQEWGVEHAPNVDVNDFEHIDVVKGASALKYGNEGVGGVVVLEPAILPKKDTVMGSVRLSGISNGRGGELGANVAKVWENQWFVKAGGSYRKTGDQYVPHHTLQNTGMEFNSFNFSFGKHSFLQGFDVSYSGTNQEFGIYKGAHLASPEDFYNAVNFGQSYYLDQFTHNIDNPKQEVAHHIAKLSAYRRFAEFGKLTFQYSFQLNRRKEYDIRRGELSNVPSMDLRLITHSASLVHLIERSDWSLESGISGSFQDNFPDPATKARRLIPDYYRYDAGAFSVFKYRFNSKLNAEAAVRYDFSRYDAYKYYDADKWNDNYADIFPEFFVSESGSRILTRPILDYHNFSANFGLDYKPIQNFELKLNLSRADRTPNAAELFSDGLHHSAAVMEEGNLNIKKETVYNVNLSLAGHFDVLRGLHIEANPYVMMSDNFVNQIPTSVLNTNRGVFPVWSYQQIKARIYGLDADAELNILDNLKWKSGFSILRGDDLSNDEPLILMMPGKLRNSIEINLSKPKNFYVSLENENTFKQNRFPIRNLPVTFIKDGVEYNETVDFSSTPAAYTLFNASIGADLFKNLNFNFRINNLFNTEYKEYLNRLRYYMFEPGRNFVVTLKYNF
ncbi:TonB-dependent receptor [Epilithonimonas ginsengisoli]|uniref:TonB-dependent receptor n=1 Tax=Epilithonimonas ginsengisoli TaxID=1245592 RepID=A0ABU4JC97_9FLAO|nr:MULTISPECIES: TonB-dependent receptor [Chryseobacterium group]MBV6878463.1 TonB-dependent receptor [Epilithonimonas sp. FP105]MDW8547294.1 TonB-dependent receptor [Epilithonimonas ginsengisoli]OAH69103.1 TonB-dependent receptor [Chryseobacterium sp. FP211-J200]